jgi:hypothetical protein
LILFVCEARVDLCPMKSAERCAPRFAVQKLGPRYWWSEFVRQVRELRGKPHEILHTVLAVSLAVMMRASKLAAALGVWVSNPLTIPFFYYGSYRLGRLVLGLPPMTRPTDYSLLGIINLSGKVAGTMLLGGVVLGIVLGLLTYFITLKFTSSEYFRGRQR